ncbi:hypothetical protein H0B43_01710 [Rhodococcus wratislaviensis]|nr:hypothetical protein [Rhodococcus sp. 4CII]
MVDDYLEFLEGRCRSNTVLAAYDLRVFFTVVAKAPAEVAPANVLAAHTPSVVVELVSAQGRDYRLNEP